MLYQTNIRPVLGDTAMAVDRFLQSEKTAIANLAIDTVWAAYPKDPMPTSQLSELHDAPYGMFAYYRDSLVFWNRYDYLMPQSSALKADTLIHLKNGYYWRLSFQPAPALKLIVLYPIAMDYALQNPYLPETTAFSHLLSRQEQWQPMPTNEVRCTPLAHGLGYLVEGDTSNRVPHSSRLLFTLSMLLAWWSFARLFSFWGRKLDSPWLAFAGLLVLTGGIRLISLLYYPEVFTHIELFSPRHYGASDLAPSLGDLLLNVLLVLYWVLYWVVHVPMPRFTGDLPKALATIVGLVSLLSAGLYILEIAETLVIDSNIVFAISDVFAIDYYSLIGLFIMAMLMLTWFLLMVILVPFGWGLLAATYRRWLAIAVALVGYLLVSIWWLPLDDILLAGAVGSGLIVIFALLHGREQRLQHFWTQVFWLTLFAIVTATFLDRFTAIKQEEHRMLYARSLTQQDHMMSFLFSQVKPQLTQDVFIRGYFANPLISKRQLERRLNFLYFKDQLNTYDVEVYTYLENAIPYKNEVARPLSSFFMQIDSSGRTTNVQDLYFFPETPNNLAYLAMLRIYSDPANPISENQIGRIVISFSIKSYGSASLYPELLLTESIREKAIEEQYDYAFYVRNKLVKRAGSYPYPLQYKGAGGEQFHAYEDEDFRHLIYEEIPGRSIWLTSAKPSFLAPFSLFSYLFCLFLVLLLLGNAGYVLYRYSFGFPLYFRWRYITFRSRIQLLIVLIIVLSFALIGWVTVTNIKREYNDYHYDRLLRKTRQILSGLEYMRAQASDSVITWEAFFQNDDLYYPIVNLSEIHAMDINLYDKEGALLVSSQPEIFNKGLIERLQDPVAKAAIEAGLTSQYVQSETIGAMPFISAYVPLLNPDQKITATLNLPYFAKEKNLKAEINSFLVYFINIYVLLFVLAGMVGILISNSILRPLTVLGNKMQQVTLANRNEPIHWYSRDEIGQLITEYNKMIAALEESVGRLAMSERESAWRDMAKQVAHEIKNPLTPMKLGIQLLQRAQKEGAADLQERVAKTADTLIEQIENLNRIASEFSNFAKMPTAEMEPLELNELLDKVIHLFDHTPVSIIPELPNKALVVNADKNHLLRVFNNLIKNAIQAIPNGREGRIKVVLRAQEQQAIVEIIDNGIGISAEQADKVFVPNFTTKSSGMGIGLAMARQIIEQANGTITFTSEVGVGTTFFVTLPLFEEEKEQT